MNFSLKREILKTIKASDRLYNIFKKQSKNRKRIGDIREELKIPKYNILKSESKDIKRNLYNIEKQRKICLKIKIMIMMILNTKE